jgi:hypothetical protein
VFAIIGEDYREHTDASGLGTGLDAAAATGGRGAIGGGGADAMGGFGFGGSSHASSGAGVRMLVAAPTVAGGLGRKLAALLACTGGVGRLAVGGGGAAGALRIAAMSGVPIGL